MVRLLFLFVTMVSFAYAGERVFYFHVDSPTMVDVYWNIFNAIVALFKNEGYIMAMKLIFLIGGVITFFMGVIRTGEDGSHRGLFHFGKYLIGGVAIMTILGFNSTSTSDGGVSPGETNYPSKMVIISDKLQTYCDTNITIEDSYVAQEPTLGTVVGGVPETLAWGFSFFNKIGTETTRLAKTAFGTVGNTAIYQSSLSDYAAYLQNIKNLLSVSLGDIEAGAKTSSLFVTSNTSKMTVSSLAKTIWNQCVFIPAGSDSENGPSIISTFLKTGDLRRTLLHYKNGELLVYKNPQDNNPATIATGVTVNGVAPVNLLASVFGETYRCGDLITDFEQALNHLEDVDFFCTPELKTLDKKSMAILTGSVFTSAVPSAAFAKQIIIQAGLANQVYDAKKNIALGELPYATGKSIAEFSLNSLGTGYYMAKMIPYIQAGMRAILYAFFPFVFLVVLLPGGLSVLINYLQSLLWIELWAPTAAILDMFLSFMSSEPFEAMFKESGMNYINATQAFSDASMMASVAGYLYASVPALTWLILKGSGFMLGNITSSVGAVMTKNMDSNVIDMDRSTVISNQLINKMEGINKIGIAEQTRYMSAVAGSAIAGRYLGYKEAGMDRIAKSAKGSTLEGVSTGMGSERALGGDPSKLDKVAKQHEVEVEKLVAAGNILQNMDKKDLENLVEGVAADKVSEDSAKGKMVKSLAKEWNIDLKKAEGRKELIAKMSDAKAFQKAVDTITQKALQENIGVGKLGRAMATMQMTDIAAAVSKLNQLGRDAGVGNVIDEKGHINEESFEKVKEFYAKSGEWKAAELESIAQVVKSAGTENVRKAMTNQHSVTIGQNLAQPEKIEKELKALRQFSSPEMRRKIDRIVKGLHSSDKETRTKAIMAGAALAAPIGAEGKMLNSMVADKTVDAMKTFGVSVDDMAKVKIARLAKDKEMLQAYAEGMESDETTRGMIVKDLERRQAFKLRDEDGKILDDEKEQEIREEFNKKFGTTLREGQLHEEFIKRQSPTQQKAMREFLESRGVKTQKLEDIDMDTRISAAMNVGGSMTGTSQSWEESTKFFQAELEKTTLSAEEKGRALALIMQKRLAAPVLVDGTLSKAYRFYNPKATQKEIDSFVGNVSMVYGAAAAAASTSSAALRGVLGTLTGLSRFKNTQKILIKIAEDPNAPVSIKELTRSMNNMIRTAQQAAKKAPRSNP